MVMVYIQLIIGNVMRHAQAGLAIPDFPTMGWTFFPTFDFQAWLNRVNAWRFENNLDPVNMGAGHGPSFLHRHRSQAF